MALNARKLRSLEGARLAIGTVAFMVDVSKNQRGTAAAGNEGYVLPMTCEKSGHPHALKVFNATSSSRMSRTSALAALGLEDVHPMLAGAPIVSFEGQLPLGDAKEHLQGAVMRWIAGEPFDEALEEGLAMDGARRRTLAIDLAEAVTQLERRDFVHGDIAMQNLLVSDSSGALVDFDGFRMPGVPDLTLQEGRGFGRDGYRHGSIRIGDESAHVSSDRVALATTMCELMAWECSDAALLGRDTMFDQTDLDARRLQMPDDVVARWPGGFALAERAISAQRPEDAPSPGEWLALLGGNAAPLTRDPMAGVPLAKRLKVSSPTTGTGPLIEFRRLRGSFGPLSADLDWLQFKRTPTVVTLFAERAPSGAVLKRVDGSEIELQASFHLNIREGDELHALGWQLTAIL